MKGCRAKTTGFCVIAVLILAGTFPERGMGKRGFPIIAHRALSGMAPENTLAAVKMALSSGIPALEIDVRQTLDSVLVVIHDARLDRTTYGQGLVSQTPFTVLREFEIRENSSFSSSHERIPTLKQVLDCVGGKAHLFIEIKEGGWRYPGIEERVVGEVIASEARSWCSIQSFHFQTLEAVHLLGSEIPLYWIVVFKCPILPVFMGGKVHWGRPENPGFLTGIQVHWMSASKAFIRGLHGQGLAVHVWTVNRAGRAGRLLRRGADGIITDDPVFLMEHLGHNGRENE